MRWDQLRQTYDESDLEEYIELLGELKVASLQPELTLEILNRKLFI